MLYRSIKFKPVVWAVMTMMASLSAMAEEVKQAEANPDTVAETVLPQVEVSEKAYSETTTTVKSGELDSQAARDTRDIFQNQTGVSVGGWR